MLKNTDPKTRFILAWANLCLFAGLMLWLFAHPASQDLKNLVHFVAGLLLGVSIALNFHALRRRRRASDINC